LYGNFGDLDCACASQPLQVRGARKRRQAGRKAMSVTSGTKRSENSALEIVIIIIQAILIAIVIRTFLFQPFNIPSGSMKATLLIGDYLFVSKYSYGYSHYSLPFSPPLFSGRAPGSWTPERGDVVVFRLPRDTSTDYIKRVIGLPGDKIQVIDGQVHINGTPIKREPAEAFVDVEEGVRDAPVKRWKETLSNGVSYYTLDLVDNGFADNTQVYTVPDGHYFMMGDNRDNSTDSRFSQVGTVPFENIVGKAQVIFFSVYEGERAWQFWRWPVSVRWNRLFSFVR
jgi:signal peptidase I